MSKKGLEYIRSPAKRRLDVVGAIALAPFFAPFVAAGLPVSLIDTRQNPIFTQERLGRNGEPFNIIKLRTLRKVQSAAHLVTETNGTRDHRATPIGNFLRRTGVDEMPQLINVAAGHLSMIGIRSMIEFDHDKMNRIDSGLHKEFVIASEQIPGFTGPDSLYRKIQPAMSDDVWRFSMHLGVGYRDNASFQGDIDLIGYAARVMFGVRAEEAVGHIIDQYILQEEVLQDFREAHAY